MANTIETLRGHLFKTLEALNDEKNPMDVGRAKAVAEVAQVVINSAKVEVEHLRVTQGNSVSFFLESNLDESELDANSPKSRIPDFSRVKGSLPAGVTIHRAK